MADTEDKVNKAKKLIHNVVETVSPIPLFSPSNSLRPTQAASIPEGQNELKRNQLRELAALNGTLRDDENQACQNCKSLLCIVLPLTNNMQAVKSAIASTIALNSATSRQTSSAAPAATLDTWPETAPIVNVGATLAMGPLEAVWVDLRAGLAA